MATGVTRREILEALDRMEPVTVEQLAGELGADEQPVREVVHELEREGMVSFRPAGSADDPASGSVTHVSLEEKGRQALASGF